MSARRITPSRVAAALAAVGLFAGCADVADTTALRTTNQALRPTEGEGQFGTGYGDVLASSYATPGGLFRIWYVEEGRHQAWPGDDDASGVPDYVELVGRIADEVGARVMDEGWNFPLSDTALSTGGDDGGDARFDIYLVDIGNGDGFLVGEACTGSPPRCSAHAVIENDFFGYGYPSLEYAVGVLVSHEFFHGVQNAYNADIPAWWSEGTATWFEEHFNAEQNDFERLLTNWFDEPERSLNAIGRGPSDGFPYGTAVLPWFIAESYGYEAVQGIFERYGSGGTIEEAIAAELEQRGETLDEALARWALWTTFTGERAIDGFGYPDAGRLPAFELQRADVDGSLNVDLEVEPMAARHIELTLSAPTTLEVRALDGWDVPPLFVAATSDELGTSGAYTTLTPGAPVRFEAGTVVVAAANGAARDERAARLALRPAADDAPTPDDGAGDGSGDTQASDDGAGSGDGCAVGARGERRTPWAALLALSAALLRRRR